MRMTGFVMCWFLASSMYWTVVEMTSDGPQEDLEDSEYCCSLGALGLSVSAVYTASS